jgi:hypothetical protein
MLADVTTPMRSLRLPLLALALVVLAGSALAQSEAAAWSAVGFTETLSIQDQIAAGMAKLTTDEQTLLNASVAKEVGLARAGNVRAFAGTFISRRTPDERAKAGLDRLTPDEQARLNNFVAVAIASGPVRRQSAQFLGKDAVNVINRLQVHGEVSLTIGSSGHGRSFYDTSFFTTITDPETNLTIGVGYEQFKGNGGYGYGYGYGYGPDDYAYSDLGLHNRGFDLGLGTAGYVRRH